MPTQPFIQQLLKEPNLFRKICGTTVEDFQELAKGFQKDWQDSERPGKIGSFDDAVLMSILYHKADVDYELLENLFNINSEKVRQIINLTSPFLHDHSIISDQDLTGQKIRSKNINDLISKYPDLVEIFTASTEIKSQTTPQSIQQSDFVKKTTTPSNASIKSKESNSSPVKQSTQQPNISSTITNNNLTKKQNDDDSSDDQEIEVSAPTTFSVGNLAIKKDLDIDFNPDENKKIRPQHLQSVPLDTDSDQEAEISIEEKTEISMPGMKISAEGGQPSTEQSQPASIKITEQAPADTNTKQAPANAQNNQTTSPEIKITTEITAPEQEAPTASPKITAQPRGSTPSQGVEPLSRQETNTPTNQPTSQPNISNNQPDNVLEFKIKSKTPSPANIIQEQIKNNALEQQQDQQTQQSQQAQQQDQQINQPTTQPVIEQSRPVSTPTTSPTTSVGTRQWRVPTTSGNDNKSSNLAEQQNYAGQLITDKKKTIPSHLYSVPLTSSKTKKTSSTQSTKRPNLYSVPRDSQTPNTDEQSLTPTTAGPQAPQTPVSLPSNNNQPNPFTERPGQQTSKQSGQPVPNQGPQLPPETLPTNLPGAGSTAGASNQPTTGDQQQPQSNTPNQSNTQTIPFWKIRTRLARQRQQNKERKAIQKKLDEANKERERIKKEISEYNPRTMLTLTFCAVFVDVSDWLINLLFLTILLIPLGVVLWLFSQFLGLIILIYTRKIEIRNDYHESDIYFIAVIVLERIPLINAMPFNTTKVLKSWASLERKTSAKAEELKELNKKIIKLEKLLGKELSAPEEPQPEEQPQENNQRLELAA